MITKIRLEILPRYGTKLGNVWITQQDEEGKGNEDVVGSFVLRNEEEIALWKKIIEEADNRVQQELLQDKGW